MATAKKVNDICNSVMILLDTQPVTVELGDPSIEYIIPSGWQSGMLLIAADGSITMRPDTSEDSTIIRAIEAHQLLLCDATLQTVRDGLEAEAGNAELLRLFDVGPREYAVAQGYL